MYFTIYNGDGDTYVRQLTKEEVLERAAEGEKFLTPEEMEKNADTNYWGERTLLIKGDIVIPTAKEVAVAYDVE